MEQEPIEFALTGADGKPHSYMLNLHPAIEGQIIVWRLIAAGGEPLGRLLSDALSWEDLFGLLVAGIKGGKAEALDRLLDDPKALQGLLAKLNLRGIGVDLRAVVLSDLDVAGLARDTLRHTFRDGVPLDNDTNFDAAFAGNYAEMLRAVFRSVRENGFFALSGMLPTVPA